MANSSGRPPDTTPAWPVGCGLAVLSLLLMFNLLGLAGVLAASAGLPPWLALAVPLGAVGCVPLAEIAGALWLRRRNPYAARALAWSLAIGAALLALAYLYTSWLDRASGL
jgi:hypothetical protein